MNRSELAEPHGREAGVFALGCRRRAFIALAAVAALVAAFLSTGARAVPLAERVTPEVLKIVYPGAERLGPEQGKPPAMAVYKGNDIVGYVFSTLDVVASPGYSSVPFDAIAGVTTDGLITGAKVISHHEPYILGDLVRQPKLDTYMSSHAGMSVIAPNARLLPPEFITGATVSGRSMRAGLIDSARIVLRARAPRRTVTEPTLDLEGFSLKSWDELIAQGSMVRYRITNRDAKAMMEKAAGTTDVTPDIAYGTNPDEPYFEVFAGLATPQAVGRNLLGRDFAGYTQRLLPGTHVIAVASNGPYDFLGTRFYQTGTSFERIRVVQDGRVMEFKREQFQRLGSRAGTPGIRAQDLAALYFMPPETKFEPLKPWALEFSIYGSDRGGKRVSTSFQVPYRVPPVHILMPDVPPTPAWIEAWQDSQTNVIVLGAALVVLTLILAFQSWLTRYRAAHRWVRNGFLVFVVVWLGWIAGAQLSIINVMNYMLAPFRGFDVTFYLAEPLMVMVALYTAVSLILLGRGVFCGWLCPFGALQELLGQTSRALRLPQWNPSEGLQRRLWIVKYIAAAIVLGLAFIDTDMATTASEVEPFKTAITSHFTRAWPFVLYAAALLAMGLFTERAYCRFLCPLGGTLAALDRLHLVDMLKRRPECGSPCHLCETSCPVKAIERSGKIQMAECFQCLDCQVEYYDDRRCPPLAKARKLGERGNPEPIAIPVAARGAAAE